jgi:nucleoid DNA-binding protein
VTRIVCRILAYSFLGFCTIAAPHSVRADGNCVYRDRLFLALEREGELNVEGVGVFYLQQRRAYTRKSKGTTGEKVIAAKRYLRLRIDPELQADVNEKFNQPQAADLPESNSLKSTP